MENCKTKTELRLLHSLNKFIALLAHLESPSQSKNAGSKKLVANYLRLNLLSPLRQLQAVPNGVKPLDIKERELLVQWWITLLNFLNSDYRGLEQEVTTPLLGIEVCSVALECISRIMPLVGLAATSKGDLDVFAYHTLLVVHFVTNRLIFNTKRCKSLMSNKQMAPSYVKQQLQYHNQYNTLLNSFTGKLIAYAFFYLDAEFRYDFQVLNFLEPGVCPVEHAFLAFPWKTKDFKPRYQRTHKDSPDTLTDQDKKIFQVMISYLKNDTIFVAFYWHYWHIVLSLFAAHNLKTIDTKAIPGCRILIRYISKNLDSDLSAFTRFIKSQENDNFQHTRPNGHVTPVTGEQLNNFVFVNFKTIKLWECVRTLVGCVHPAMPELLCNFVELHDTLQLKRFARIPAHDYQLGNLIYNKLLQFIVFQFNSMTPYLVALDWRKWSEGLTRMLKTLNVNCQSVALLSLFNIWDFIPTEEGLRAEIANLLVMNMWNHLARDTCFEVIRILFFKIVVFRLLSDTSSDNSLTKNHLVKKLQETYKQALTIADRMPDRKFRESSKDALIFHINRKLILSKVDAVSEEDIISNNESKGTDNKNLDKRKQLPIPSVLTAASVRPCVIISRGRYPFDILDEMVLKATKKAAKQQGNNSHSDLKVSRRFMKGSSSSKVLNESLVDDNDNDDNDDDDDDKSVARTFGSFFSKFGSSSTKTSKKAKALLSERFARNSNYDKQGNRSESFSSSDVKLDSESIDIMSMYTSLSTGSSLSMNKSESSLELRTEHSNLSIDSSTRRRAATIEGSNETLPQQPQKKKKLLAPPELKFSGDINGQTNIKWLFRLVTAPISGSTTSTLSKVQQANDRWGIVNAKNYAKPLPPPFDNFDNTLDGGVDVSPLTASINDINLSEGMISASREGFRENNLGSTPGGVPLPDITILTPNVWDSVCTDDFDDHTLTSAKSIKKREENFEFQSSESEFSASFAERNVLTMRHETELNKMVKLISVFNETAAERTNFTDMVHSADERILMDSEISSFRSSQNVTKNTVNAQIEYL
ncbi:LANO_0G11936g1_1 [Lachancea nothofagi CBS 11611]|uniref:LANO_0G11936g1_1 n=1 Tax=Lachancea nothofagi CBS 11611 TaxID=1266666 RepID=A0A1G4KJW1_9SACH|nr:LANO_0G11936g1_1 [Lachancea nothofagi CBS 11611]